MALSGASTMVKSNLIPILWTSHCSEKMETIPSSTKKKKKKTQANELKTNKQKQFQGGIGIFKNINEGAAQDLEITWMGVFRGRAPSTRSGHGDPGEE